MKRWIWIDSRAIGAIHDEQLAEHGGGAGVRDAGLLASALARPVNLAAHEKPDVARLAASYAVGLARNHPFIDGNWRSAFVAMELFLALNKYELLANDIECVTTMLAVAVGEWDEAALTDWIRGRLAKR